MIARRVVAAALAAALAAVLAAAPAAAGTPQGVAVIEGARCARDAICRDAAVTGARYRHWVRIARRTTWGRGAPEIASGLRAQVMELLISFHWIRGEAGRRGIFVTPQEVRESFRSSRDGAFARRRDFRRFLRDSGQTRRDILFRVRLDLLSIALREHVTAPAGDDPYEQQRLMDEFIVEFREHWSSMTRCAPRYRVASCAA